MTFSNKEEVQELLKLLGDQEWRLNNLYWIEDKQGQRVRFRMNRAQRKFYRTKHIRKIILKARQLGFSTLMALIVLDTCLFTPDMHAIITDKKMDEAKKKIAKAFKAFDLMDFVPPNATKEDVALAEVGRMVKQAAMTYGSGPDAKPEKKLRHTETRLSFGNGSWFEANTSGRGDTVRMLWVSELGYISAHDPIRAREIVTGAFPAADTGLIVIESTHEGGKNGENYEQNARAMAHTGPLTRLDFMHFFFGWYWDEGYTLELPEPLPMDAKQREYFDRIDANNAGEFPPLTDAQKNWWLTQFRIYRDRMYEEYPSTAQEALEPRSTGAIFGDEVNYMRSLGRWGVQFEVDPYRPIYTSWDLGIHDYMVIWWWQPGADGKMRALDCYIANGKPLAHYIDVLRQKDAELGRCSCCYLPHDGSHRDFNLDSYSTIFRRAGYRVKEVPRTNNKWRSIEHVRTLLRTCILHQRCLMPNRLQGMQEGEAYPSGGESLIFYRMAPPGKDGVLTNEPLHDKYSHGCDAVRCFADAQFLGMVAPENGWSEEEPTRAQRRNPSRALGAEMFD